MNFGRWQGDMELNVDRSTLNVPGAVPFHRSPSTLSDCVLTLDLQPLMPDP